MIDTMSPFPGVQKATASMQCTGEERMPSSRTLLGSSALAPRHRMKEAAHHVSMIEFRSAITAPLGCGSAAPTSYHEPILAVLPVLAGASYDVWAKTKSVDSRTRM
jgi:hypothetical protein